MKTLTIFSTLVSLMLFALMLGCGGGNSIASVATVHAGTPDCTPEFFFDGPQRPEGGGVIEGPHNLWFVSAACVMQTPVNATYVTTFEHNVQLMTIQMGSNQDSVFEWDQVITATTPSGEVLINQQQQYDKHIDDHGNKQERYLYPVPIRIPIGSTIRISRRAQVPPACTHAGKWGDRQECVTGGSVQFQDVVK